MFFREHHSSNLSFGSSVCTTCKLIPSGPSMVVFTVTPLGTSPRRRCGLVPIVHTMETRGEGTRVAVTLAAPLAVSLSCQRPSLKSKGASLFKKLNCNGF